MLSPHLDDALFSASEVIRSTTTEVWTVFAGEPQPALTTAWDRTCGFPDSHALMIERLDEDKRAFADTQADIRHLPYLDGAYTTPERRAADLEDLRRELSAWIEQHSGDQPIVVLPAGAGVPVADPLGDRMAHVTHRIASTPGILAPLVQPLRGLKHRLYQHRRRSAQGQGLAVNEDHRAVRDTALALLRRDPRVTVVLMEDLPYLWWHPADDAVKEAAAKNGLNATKRRLIVDRRWKNEHISEYTSQLHTMDVDQNRLAKTETLPENEYYWILNRETNPPLTVPESLQD
ncbi:hypothetical protein SDC9_61733 [bioreactor metagenome]|uniref:Uncharacterized protein n=1 Tax=bioreactor metagenome TaxID=1076179 RepID=A0A644XMS3_9ZZZZ